MKHSKRQRKYINAMRGMSDIPWPARRYRYAPTFSNVIGSGKHTHIGHCKRPVGEHTERVGRIRRRTKTTVVACGGRVFLRRGSLGRRRVYCESCRARRDQERQVRRFAQRYARLAPREQAAEQRREASRLKRMLRRGARG